MRKSPLFQKITVKYKSNTSLKLIFKIDLVLKWICVLGSHLRHDFSRWDLSSQLCPRISQPLKSSSAQLTIPSPSLSSTRSIGASHILCQCCISPRAIVLSLWAVMKDQGTQTATSNVTAEPDKYHLQ